MAGDNQFNAAFENALGTTIVLPNFVVEIFDHKVSKSSSHRETVSFPTGMFFCDLLFANFLSCGNICLFIDILHTL